MILFSFNDISNLNYTIVNDTTISIPYSVFNVDSNTTVEESYNHKIDYDFVESINTDKIRAKVTPNCRNTVVCVDKLTKLIQYRLQIVLNDVVRRKKCFSNTGIIKNIFWVFYHRTWCTLSTKGYPQYMLEIENKNNVSDSIKSFVQINHLRLKSSGVNITDLEMTLRKTIVEQVDHRYLEDHDRWISFSVLVLGTLFAVLYNFARPYCDERQDVFVESNLKLDEANKYIFFAHSFLIFSHSYGFLEQPHLEPVRYHFKRRSMETLGSMTLSVTLFLSGFLCQASSFNKFDAYAKSKNNKLISIQDRIFIGARTFLTRCNRIFASYFNFTITFAIVSYLFQSMSNPNGIGFLTRDTKTERELVFLFAGSIENAFFAVFPTPLLEPKKAITGIFAGSEINDSMWTIPHQIFCYFLAFVVDTLSNSNTKIVLLMTTCFIYYILRIIQVTDDNNISREYIFLPKMKWGGQSRRFTVYANFALGGLWYHLCRLGQVNISYTCSISTLFHFMPFAFFIVIPWILGTSILFHIFYPPLLGIFSLYISMGSSKGIGQGGRRAIENIIYKSTKTLYFYGAPIQKILIFFFQVSNPITITLVTIVMCIGLHNAMQYICHCCCSLSCRARAEPLNGKVVLLKKKRD
jgi:hypothetical protein